MKLLETFIDSLKAPWPFMVTLVTIIFTCFVLIDESAFGTVAAFKFAAVMVGAFGTTMVMAAAAKAYPTMMLMLIGVMVMAIAAALSLDAEAFKDQAFEGMMLMIAGSVAILLKTLIKDVKSATDD